MYTLPEIIVTANKKTILKISNKRIKLNLTPPRTINPKSKITNLCLNKKVNKNLKANVKSIKIKHIEKKKFIILLILLDA